MNHKEIQKIIDKTWGQGKTDIQSILKEIDSSVYKFNKNEKNEILNVLYSKQGLTVTPNSLTELIAYIGRLYSTNSIIDICCGTGNILTKFKDSAIVKGIDINADIIETAKNFSPAIEFIVADTLKYDFENFKYDIVLGSLPFGIRTIDDKSLEIELMKKGLSLINDNGIAIYIVPDNLLITRKAKDFRKTIIKNYAIDMIISLPEDTFYPFARIKASIICIRNGKPNKKVFMTNFSENPNEIVSNYKHHKGEFYLPLSKLDNRLDRSYYRTINIIKENLDGKEIKILSEMAEIIKGKPIPNKSLKKHGRFQVFYPYSFPRKDYYVDEIPDEKCILKPSDIVLSLIITNDFFYVHNINNPETVIRGDYVIVRSNQGSYISTFLQSKEGKDLFYQLLLRYSGGTGVQRIRISELLNLPIPILPLSELSFIDKDWLNNTSKDNLIELERKLKELIFHYEKDSEQHLQMTKEILKKLTYQNDISIRIEKKIDKVINIISNLNYEISQIKKINCDIEKKIKQIYSEIDEKFLLINKESEKEILEKRNNIKLWLTNWNLLHAASLNFLSSAELLFSRLPIDTDYSPFVLQYCRALENEILKKLFEAYHLHLNENNINKEELISIDIINDKTKLFADSIRRDRRNYTLGSMSFIMNLLKNGGGKTFESSPLLQDFCKFTLVYYENNIFQKNFLDDLKNITENYRNKSAHTSMMNIDAANECQKIVQKTINELLMLHKGTI